LFITICIEKQCTRPLIIHTFNKSSGWVQQAADAEATPPWYHKDVRFVRSTFIFDESN